MGEAREARRTSSGSRARSTKRPRDVRGTAELDEKLPLFRVLARRSLWFVRLRWMVPPAMVLAIGVGRLIGLEFESVGLLWVAGAVLLYNALLRSLRARVTTGHLRTVEAFTWTQMTLDYLAMFALIRLTGGLSSPVIVFFLFHIILAAILLRPLAAWLCATLAVVGVACIAVYDAWSGAAHPIRYHGEALAVPMEPRLLLVGLLVFAAAAYAMTFLSTTVIRELRRTTADLFESRAVLERISADRDRFMLQMTHNLKAPAAACVSLAEVISGDYLGPLNDKQREYMAKLQRRLHGLLDTTSELLAIARHRNAARETRRAPVDLGALATRIHQVFLERAKQRGLTLALEVVGEGDALQVIGDEQLLEQAIENLVSNAVKYTREGRVTVRVSRSGPNVVVEVEDTGIGIPDAARGKLFSEFFRAKNAKDVDPGGTGLGLAATRQTVLEHGGSIEVDSRENAGSRFTIALPSLSSKLTAPPSALSLPRLPSS